MYRPRPAISGTRAVTAAQTARRTRFLLLNGWRAEAPYLSTKSGAHMSYHSSTPYRGYKIDVHIASARTLSFHGVGRRYKVSWTITSSETSAQVTTGFPERLEFMSEREAFVYANNRAHTFIDCMLSEAAAILAPAESARAPAPN
jgi:hypothetical protein